MATAYVITGTRKPGDGSVYVRRSLAGLHSATGNGARFITGAQYGVDLLALDQCLASYPWADHSVWCPAGRHAAAEVQAVLAVHRSMVREHGGRIQVREALPGTDYPYRNLLMLQEAWGLYLRGWQAQVHAYPLHPEGHGASTRSGTWKCVRQARAAGLPVALHQLWAPDLQT